jgi:branched-chain amino acid transport system ATP-binding protein
MLAVGRLLRTGAKLLLLDEPTEGLAPVLIRQIGQVVNELKQRGLTILLVEQNVKFAAALADRQYVVEDGVVVDEIGKADFAASRARLEAHLGI